MVRCSRQLKVVLLIVFVILHFSRAVDYCNIPKCGSLHTFCRFPVSGPSDLCKKSLIKSGLTAEEKKKIVDLHNEFRQKVYNGNETRGNPGPQPSAKSMPIIQWDNELAGLAQRWADQCQFSHDQCRDLPRFMVGQSFASKGTTRNPKNFKIEDLVMIWYNEVANHPRNNVASFRFDIAKNIGHYSQMVWANSTLIGCGGIKYKDGKWNKFNLVCNYGPAGNVVGAPIYESL